MIGFLLNLRSYGGLILKKFAAVSLGCAKNLVDSEIMLGQLTGDGWEYTPDFAEAELILVNTCGFIESAKRESVEVILEMAGYKQSGVGRCRILAVAGCLVQRYAADLMKDLPEVDVWVGLGEIDTVAAKLNSTSRRAAPSGKAPFLNEANLPRFQATLRHTAYVKIAEGCNHCCSYCAIPVIKGCFRSRSQESIVREIRELVAAGVKEVNLIAQDISMYGRDLTPRTDLPGLLRVIISQAKPEWIRLLYAHPSGIDRPLLQLMAEEPSVCKYLDLPMQHINARILKLMNRPDSPEDYKDKLSLVREILPQAAVRTTFITGFPTETEAEFAELLEFVKIARFDYMGVFGYSREEDTAAYNLKPQIKPAVKEERRNRLLAVQQEVSTQLLSAWAGRESLVLVDKLLPDGRAVGRTAEFAPDVDGVVYIEAFPVIPGEFVKCRITGNDAYNLFAKVVPT
jgi:ribosomal protein S12 methylthiotransferase